MKVAIYCRVSTRDKEQNPDVQLFPLRKYADAMQWEVFGNPFIDKASAADLEHRIAWNDMMKKASKHEFDVLLVWKLDRAFRSMQHATTTIGQLNGYRVGFRSYMDASIDTTTPNGMLVFNILASVAQFEKDLLTQRVHAGIEYAQEHGTKSGKPIGRDRNPITDSEILMELEQHRNSRSAVARHLSEKHGVKVSAGFISLRAKRALQTPPLKTKVLQA